MNIVVGSGPAGIACATRLLEAGASVTMLDIGVEREAERSLVVERMSALSPEQWDPQDLSLVTRSGSTDARQSEPPKLAFGSTFPYADPAAAGLEQRGTRCVMSWARGGLSNVWGAAMLPFAQDDTSAWPIDSRDWARHYRAVSELVGLTGLHDRLERLYPFYHLPATALEPSAQARRILERMEQGAAALHSLGLTFGRSRLAVQASSCRACGQCLTGCVYGAIYSTRKTLQDLEREPGFRYLSKAEVRACRDEGGEAVVSFRDRSTGTTHELRARRVFIAAGVLGTAKIVVASLGMARATLGLSYHPYFLLPMLTLRNQHGVAAERLHALAQGFIELVDRTVSHHTVHMQLYTYSPLFARRLAALGPLKSVARTLLLGRLVAIQGFLNSLETDPIRMDIALAADDSARIRMEGSLSSNAKALMRRVSRRLLRATRHTGLVPLSMTMEIGQPGDGNHIGCTFPMSRTPTGLQSDTQGRVGGARRVHVVDASVLPSIPASTITLGVMANARRIAEASLALDAEELPCASP